MATDNIVARYQKQFRRPSSSDPAWLRELRQDAMERFEQTGFPTTHDEDWRFTSVQPIADTPFELARPGADGVSSDALARVLGKDVGPRLVFVDGRWSRALSRLDDLQKNWTEKAELALSKDREDLAKAALLERQKAADMADSLAAEIGQIEDVLRGYEVDIAKLQGKLREARARQNAIAARFESAFTRARANEIMHGGRTQDAFSKFELLERRADLAEGRADALGIGSLEDEIDQLRTDEKIDAELHAMKAALSGKQEEGE